MQVHFNGGVNLPDTESVLRALAPHRAKRLPDGETGQRAQWIGFQLPLVRATPGLVFDDHTPANDYSGGPTVRLAPGTDPATLPWPDLGYAREYTKSYKTFTRLRDEGVIRPGTRFQVQYPTPLAVGNLFHPDDRDRLIPSYATALLADLDHLLAQIPPEDLAVQWDAAVETVTIDLDPGRADDLTGKLAALLDHVPAAVPAGVHLCYGDFEHRHMVEPRSLRTQVELANALPRAAWVSFTVPQYQHAEEFFAPLADLDTTAELYFSLVPYHPDQPVHAAEQAALIRRHVRRDWGICTECGMARAEREDVPRLLALHFDPLG
ncbi:hypothetical protein [Amycolatopsis sp. 195334CR]|uniref:hypothetical protein n=1 Tax=Amycolatopsis sp. 195334CR TaxID=2814588 RepID=UPI001A8CBFCE|nr:hypothetical protein [Amycolatopsis sp. 195334CR]MBN6037658.1 hypothetical protein [Amycolatopsis sp. 195334CR]